MTHTWHGAIRVSGIWHSIRLACFLKLKMFACCFCNELRLWHAGEVNLEKSWTLTTFRDSTYIGCLAVADRVKSNIDTSFDCTPYSSRSRSWATIFTQLHTKCVGQGCTWLCGVIRLIQQTINSVAFDSPATISDPILFSYLRGLWIFFSVMPQVPLPSPRPHQPNTAHLRCLARWP